MADAAMKPQVHTELKPEDLAALHKQLVDQRKSILDLYHQDVRAGQASLEEGTEDLVDKANMAYSRELMFSLSDGERDQLQLIDDALARLAAGTYGVCQHSHQPIPIARLRAVPWARYRAEYQEMAEKGLLDED